MLFKVKYTYFLKNIYQKHLHISYRYLSGLNLWDEELSPEIKHKIENHWRNRIKVENFNENETSKEKYYVLCMFPYPSGFLHMGHVRVYTISDTIARYQRMNGKNVIHPIGWDAFGLPAENAAIDRQIAPEEWTKQNIAYMKKQLQELGCSFEWHRELATCDPEYYKWTQDLFLKLYNAGLVYQKEALVNWDPVDQTVLADEQVDENGCSWRSGAVVEKKLLKQWFVRTTKFAKDLLEGLNDSVLHDWRDIIKLQRHWIGKCNGVHFDFKICDGGDNVSLWTDMPEYIEHAKFVAVSNGHILAKKEVKSGERTVKLNVELENPFNSEKLPVYVTNDVEFLPGTDTFVGIPGAQEQAETFAIKYNIPYGAIPKFIVEEEIKRQQEAVCKKAQQLNIGGYWTSAKLRDWLISRQRYWGTPIPIIHCEKCGTQPVPRENLPVELPKLTKLSQKGGSQLAEVKEFINTICPKCGGSAKRETDTMDTFVDSSWYYLRYLDPKNNNEMFDEEKTRRMTPVDLYIGGKEHAVLHLYYARFVSHFLHSLGLLPEREPFRRLLVQGMVMGRSFRVKGTGEYLPETKVNILDLKRNKAVVKETGEPVNISWEKMSKSKFNGVDPDDMFKNYGIDTTRLLILADVAPTSHRNWNSNTFPGILNWQKRLWLTIRDFLKHRTNLPPRIPEDQFRSHEDFMFDSRNYYIKGTSFNYLISQQLSVAVSKQQGLTNSLRKSPPAIFAYGLQFERALATQIILLAPMAPYFASELWSGFIAAPNRLNNSEEIRWDKSVFEQTWPETDMDYNLDLVCQVNGFENSVVKIPRKDLERLQEEEAISIALKQKEVQSTLTTRNVLDIRYTVHAGCEGIVNILTDQPPPKVKVQEAKN
ncbi:probable leucine--tRNA ligase, mitochondrial [Anoplophora glabripennis]|uniref:probable leucine--tRNA ligase, mitochondrial n=1 Tax=Anoplophora glabripennis TaxID=217634 RepID=UPI000875A352|nr:probable leucine--tRNA ligase, mitochondrial [Anoplophora glabripennis]